MTGAKSPARLAALLAGALLAPCALAPAARAGAPAPDSLLRGYVRAMADSTDAYFGMSAQTADTTGLDSALVYGLAHPRAAARRHSAFSLGPDATFSRVLGVAYGAQAGLATPAGLLAGDLLWANGPDDWYGTGTWTKRWRDSHGETAWSLHAGAGRTAESLDRDHADRPLAALYAFAFGSDRQNYLRRDGAGVRLVRNGAGWWAGAGYRNQLESALATTTTWTLFRAAPVLIPNTPAAFGRASEVNVSGGALLPRSPFHVEAQLWNAGGPLGGDFDYRRVRAALAGAVHAGRHLALAPQLEYGRIAGRVVPQEVFYLGGGSSLRTLDANALQGSGRAYAHVDLMLVDDVQTLLGIRHAAAFPIQAGVFGASGARWGYDPATGLATASNRLWPGRAEWRSEAGVSLLYRPGLPAPDWFARIDYAVPIGADARSARFAISFQRALNVLTGSRSAR